MLWRHLLGVVECAHEKISQSASLVEVLPQEVLRDPLYNESLVGFVRVELVLLKTDCPLMKLCWFFLLSVLAVCVVRS